MGADLDLEDLEPKETKKILQQVLKMSETSESIAKRVSLPLLKRMHAV